MWIPEYKLSPINDYLEIYHDHLMVIKKHFVKNVSPLLLGHCTSSCSLPSAQDPSTLPGLLQSFKVYAEDTHTITSSLIIKKKTKTHVLSKFSPSITFIQMGEDQMVWNGEGEHHHLSGEQKCPQRITSASFIIISWQETSARIAVGLQGQDYCQVTQLLRST